MVSNTDNVVYPFPDTAARAFRGAQKHQAGVAKSAAGVFEAIEGAIEVGMALLEMRKDGDKLRHNVTFKQMVEASKIGTIKPFDNRQARHAAMQMAEVIVKTGLVNTFKDCPNTNPVDVMSWYRKMHPAVDKEQAPRKESDSKKQEATKAKKAKVEAPEKPKATATPKTDAAYETIVAWLDSGKKISNQRTFADERRDVASHTQFEKAFDRLNREKAEKAEAKARTDAVLAEAKTNEDAALAKAEAGFSEKSKLALADAIRIHKARLDKTFEQLVNEEVRKRIATADNAVRERLKRADAAILQFERERGKKGVFTKRQFKQLQICCHPDASASAETRAELLQILVKYETYLVNPEKE